MERARTPGGTLLLDNLLNIEAFSKQVLNRTHLAWSVHVGGGNSYKCLLYAQSNAQQMCTTEVDMLKAELLKSKPEVLEDTLEHKMLLTMSPSTAAQN